VRLFLAINLDPAVRLAVLDATSAVRAAAPGPPFSWVDDSRLHLTLKFLGEQPESAVAPVANAIDAVVARHRRFTMRVRSVGAFPNFRRARVVWMGVDPEPRLELLHHDVELACESLGFAVEGRPFRPHLTLARVKARAEEDVLRRLARAGKSVGFAEDVDVRSIDLMRSHTGGSGSRYELLHAAQLRG